MPAHVPPPVILPLPPNMEGRPSGKAPVLKTGDVDRRGGSTPPPSANERNAMDHESENRLRNAMRLVAEGHVEMSRFDFLAASNLFVRASNRLQQLADKEKMNG